MTHRIFRAKSRLLAGVGLATLLLFSPVIEGSIAPAAAQSRVTVSVEFREALEPYGKFVDHPRFGEVWQPAVSRDWKPYRDGRWAYTNDYGYYWVSGESEEDWAWVVYHYGRWVLADDLGWVWVAGDRWAPAWVQWRRSRDSRGVEVVGWAPLPPDEVIVDVVEEPDYWCFVPAVRIFEPRISVAILPFRPVYFQQTVIVNKTVFVHNDRYRFAVNPGIEPGYFAARIGRPLRAYDIRPRVFASFGEFRGAELVRPGQRVRERIQLRETKDVIRPVNRLAAPQALRPNDEGRLGERPPRAARQDQRDDQKRDQARERDGQKQDQAKDGDKRDLAKERDGEKRDQAREREQDKRQQAKEGDRRDQAKERAGQKQDQARERAEQKRQQADEQRQKATESAKQKREQAQEQREKQRQGAQERREQQEQRGEQRQPQREERARERQGADRRQSPETTGQRPAAEQRQQLREERQQGREGRGEERREQQLNQGIQRAPERAARPDRGPQAAPPQAARPDRGPPQQAAQPPRGTTTGAAPAAAPAAAPPQARQAPQAAPQAAPSVARGGQGPRGGGREGGPREGR